jgi:NADP-reducing hydrogenase subunit HndC
MRKLKSTPELAQLREQLTAQAGSQKRRVCVCSSTGCLANKSDECATAIQRELDKSGLSAEVELRRTGCWGLCERGPVVAIEPQGTCYFDVQPKDAVAIVGETVKKGGVVERLLFEDEDGVRRRTLEEIPFYRNQSRFLLRANTLIDPTRIEDYIAIGGYQSLAKVLSEMTGETVVDLIKKAELRGRGGGGFRAGTKWETTRNAPGDEKFVVVNGDEGDPGAYMDRSLLEGNPHSVLEGLIIGGYAIGAHQGFFYVRQEYPLAVENVKVALQQARAYGLLGRNILGSGFDFDVAVHCGAGSFVSGESSALMNAIEGRVGEPRPKYVHTSVKGLWDKPTNLNNVETWANVPLIIEKGVDWFRSVGTQNSKGTKVFSLTGQVRNSGLVEVPMGISLRDMVYEIGRGMRDGKGFKAVQTGGPSGGFLPESMLDVKVDFDDLWNAGSMMGSGGMIVMDEGSCMVDAARFYVNFLARESCGQCVPCREGLRQSLTILDRIVEGEGREGDVELLLELADFMEWASLCALGTSAAFPVRSAIKHFRAEFDAHIREKRCPALLCKNLVHFEIDESKCKGCLICMRECPTNAISGKAMTPHHIDQAACTKCGHCLEVCPTRFSAIYKAPGAGPLAAGIAPQERLSL